MATDQIQQKLEQDEQQKQSTLAKQKEKQQILIKQLKDKKITIKARANNEGQLYAGINSNQIRKALQTKEPIKIIDQHIIKEVGEYQITIKLGNFKEKITILIQAQ